MPKPSVLIALVLAASACTTQESIGAVREHVVADPQKLDVLFVIDRSDSMISKQQQLGANLPRFMAALQALPGGLPSVHVGVLTSDMGVDPAAPIEECTAHGDGGELQDAARVDGCTPPDDAFIADEIGAGGCGFEQPLASMRKALDGSVSKNAGFLRDDAFLAVVFITDEDDCSPNDPGMLFDSSPALDSDQSPLGALSSFRCTRWGLICDEGVPDHVGAYQGCHPRPDSLVVDTAEIVDFLTGLKDSRSICVGVVAGDPAPVSVSSRGGLLALDDSCRSTAADANPGVRLGAFGQAFAPNYTFRSICGDDLPDVISALGDNVRKMIVSYTADRRDDLAISYGCRLGGRGGDASGGLALVTVLFVLRGGLRSRSRALARR